jgi:hypothetical protein
MQTHSPTWRGFISPLTDPFYIFGQLFSDLACENLSLPTRQNGECLEKLIHTPVYIKAVFAESGGHWWRGGGGGMGVGWGGGII